MPKLHGKPAFFRNHLARGLFAAMMLMAISGQAIFAASRGSTLTNPAGNANSGPRCHGYSPEYWSKLSHPSLLNRKWARFSDYFGSGKFGQLSFYQVLHITASASKECAAEATAMTPEQPRNQWRCHYQLNEYKLARYAAAAYLNAYDARHGGGLIGPCYSFSPRQVVDLYLAAEQGGASPSLAGNRALSRENVIRLFENSWLQNY